ncbi:MAG: CPBP family intramembrane metalloprotease [Deltaproteobacteria bacterium]|nr:CPBP family intramembrane metalloprotease [Deltaproteobacteria bacterium]
MPGPWTRASCTASTTGAPLARLRPHVLRALLLKEAREVLRDRRTLLLTLALPTIIYPVFIAGLGEISAAATLSLRARPISVVVAAEVPEDVRRALRAAERVTVRAGAPEEEVRAGLAEAGVGARPRPRGDHALVVYVDRSRDESSAAAERVNRAIARARDARLQARVAALGIPREDVEPLPAEQRNVSSGERMRSYMASRMLPFLLIVLSLVGATATAVDITAGERERGTLLTLLSTPVHAAEVAAAKLVTVAAVALASGLVNVVALALTLTSSLGQGAAEFSAGLDARLLLGTMAALLPTSLYGAALLLGLAALGKTTKEAQASTAPALFLALGLSAVSIVPGVRANLMLDALPVAGPALLMRDLVMGDATLGQGLAVLISSALTLWLMVAFAARVLMSEPMLSAHLSASAVLRELGGDRRPTPLTAALVASLLLGVVVYAGPALQGADLPLGLLGTLALLAACPLLLLRGLGLLSGPLLGFGRRPDGGALAAAVLWGLALLLPLSAGTRALVRLMGMDEAAEALEEALRALMEGQQHGGMALLLVGLAPGFLEEVAFRGALQGVLLRVTTPGRAVLAQAVAFGLAHLSVIRFPGTFAVGLLLGALRWRSGSIWPGVLMHSLHNGLATALVVLGVAAEGGDDELPAALLGGCVAALVAGGWLLQRVRPPVSDVGRT